MVTVLSRVSEMESDDHRRVTEVTYLGAVHGTQAALRSVLPRDAGVIVQVGSALAYRAIPLQSAYGASQRAIQGFSESLRSELQHDGSGVRVTMVQLPALNTPQFTWMKNGLPHQPQPVLPNYQPEVAAAAIVWAAEHHPREVNVGLSTTLAIWGDKFLPGMLEHFLARTAFSGQQTPESTGDGHPVNLWHTADEHQDFGAHGKFDAIAHGKSWQWLTIRNRKQIATAVAALAALAYAIRVGRAQRENERG